MKKVIIVGSGIDVAVQAAILACKNAGIATVVTEDYSKPVLKPKNYIASSMDDLLPKVYYDKKGKPLTNPGSKYHK